MGSNPESLDTVKKKFDASMITALSAGLISLSALTVSIYEAYLQRQEQRVSVWPIMEHWTAYTGESFSIHIANKGIGPATVEHVEVLSGGRPMASWSTVFAEALGDGSKRYNQSMVVGNVMAPGDASEMVAYSGESVATAAWEASQEITLRVCYCSVFGDCWTYETRNLVAGRPERNPTDACPSGERVTF